MTAIQAQNLLSEINAAIVRTSALLQSLDVAGSEHVPIQSTDAGDGPQSGQPGQASGHSYREELHSGPLASRGRNDAHEFAMNDVDQGNLGDCGLHAALAAVAKANPNHLRSLIKDNQDGTYDVKLHIDVDGDMLPWAVDTVVTVDARFPTHENGTTAYAGNSNTADNNELWVKLFEKAIAAAAGGYDKIVGTFDGGEAMEVLQLEVGTFKVADKTAAELGTLIKTALDNKKAVTCFTPGSDSAGKKVRKIADEQDVYLDHAYAPMTVSGNRIKLFNPHGAGNEVTLSLDNFKSLFYQVEIAK